MDNVLLFLKNENCRKRIMMELMDETVDYPYTEFFDKVFNQLKNIKDFLELETSQIIWSLFKTKELVSFHSAYIMNMIQESACDKQFRYIQKKELRESLPEYYERYQVMERILNKLIEDKKILYTNRGYEIYRPCLKDWLNSFSYYSWNALISEVSVNPVLYPEGLYINTLNELAISVENSDIDKPLLMEDKLGYWYEKYNLTEKEFCTLFGITWKQYAYLNAFYEKGAVSIFKLPYDADLPLEFQQNMVTILKKDIVFIDGYYYEMDRAIIFQVFLKLYCQDSLDIETIYFEYYQFLYKYHLDKYESLLFKRMLSFKNFVDNSKNVIFNNVHNYRYYDYAEHEVATLVKQLEFEQFEDVEISSLLLFRKHKKIMIDYDIRDEYELYNFLKKEKAIWKNSVDRNITFSKTPTICIGDADRVKQVKNFLFKVAPVTAPEFCQYYEEKYGILSQTVQANFLKYLKKYYHQGVYVINQEVLNEQEFDRMRNLLKDDFYFIDDIKQKVQKYKVIEDISKINSKNLAELGYKVFSEYIIKNVYPTAQQYFLEAVLDKDVIDLNKQDKRLKDISIFHNLLLDLCGKFKIVEVYENIYVKMDYFLSYITDNQITVNDLKMYVDHVANFTKDCVFFNLYNLNFQGFSDDLFKVGLPNSVYSLVLKNLDKFKYIRVKNGFLFYNVEVINKATVIDFIKYIMAEKREINIYDLMGKVENQYNITFRKDKLIEKIRKNDMYYDKIMETIYINKKEYYNMVY